MCCSVENCDGKVHAKKMCKKHYCQYLYGLKATKCTNCDNVVHRSKTGLCHSCVMQSQEVKAKIGIKSANRGYTEEKKKEIAQKKSKTIKDNYVKNIDQKIEKYKKQIDSHNNADIEVDWSTFTNRSSKIRVIDRDYGEWWTTVSSLIDGITHPKRHTEKVKKTCMEKYGVDSTSKLQDTKEKMKQTIKDKYGVDFYAQSAEYKEQYKNTCLEKYGVEHYFASEEAHDKLRDLSLARFGVEHPFQSEEVKEKIRDTCREKYGVEWTGSIPGVKEKREATCLRKYGFKTASQNAKIALKAAKSVNYTKIKTHWKTNEELVCQGSYEAKVVDYLNNNKINYLWQPETFTLSNGSTYRPDLYLIDEDKWIEIKGYFREDAKIKWALFTAIYTNSELWDANLLKTMEIL